MIGKNYISRPAIRVDQPLGTFYAFSLDAPRLNKITYSLPASALKAMDGEESKAGPYGIFGTQRKENKRRLDEIADFIKTSDAMFPNSIILGANFNPDGNLVESGNIWKVKRTGDEYHILIPVDGPPIASIIDGQHRLHAFERVVGHPNQYMDLLCAVYLDLPMPLHAHIFATINFNQKKVDRSLAYQLFGFVLNEDEAEAWPPEMLAVHTARVLSADVNSPLFLSISPGLIVDDEPSPGNGPKVNVSFATVVDGILRLISRNPKEDRHKLRDTENSVHSRNILSEIPELPLRTLFIKGNDKAIYEIIFNYFTAISKTLWKNAPAESYLRKTVGVQAYFDVLQRLLRSEKINRTNFSVDALTLRFNSCIDLAKTGKYQASGIGRSDIRRDILSKLDLE
jgi:DNA phosphorothioation-associated DGQHR protein 1